jgi:hypothetical protein
VCHAWKTPEDGVAMAEARVDRLADHGILSKPSAEAAAMNGG